MSAAIPAGGSAAHRTALVIDDGPVERLTGKVLLEKLGFSVITADNGTQALQLLAAQPVRLVLCDVSMPGMSGIEVLAAARKQPRPPRFIMVSSHDDVALAQTALENGASVYLNKPLRFEVLREAVMAMFATSGYGN